MRSTQSSRGRIGRSVSAVVLVAVVVTIGLPASADEPAGRSSISFDQFHGDFLDGMAELQQLVAAVPPAPTSSEEASPHAAGRAEFEAWSIAASDQLRQSLGTSYAGAAVHPVDHTLYVGTTTTGDAEDGPLDDLARPDPIPDTYRVQLVDVATTAAERALAETALRSASVDDYVLMTLDDRVRVFTDDRVRVEAAAAALNLPTMPDLFESLAPGESAELGPVRLTRGSLGTADDSLSGGVTAFGPNGAARCTFGFNFVATTTLGGLDPGGIYATTAGHCTEPGEEIWRNNRQFGVVDSEWNRDAGQDWAVLVIPRAIRPGIGYVYVHSGWSVAIAGPWRSHMSGTTRAMKGSQTGYTTGTYYGVCKNFLAASYDRIEGDSGGPVMYPYGSPRGTMRAAGLHSGYCDVTEDGVTYRLGRYESIADVEQMGGQVARLRVLQWDE